MTVFRLSQILACVICLSGVGTSADAGQCGYEFCWGAVSVGPLGATGRATGVRTAPDAANAAREVCGASCGVVEVFVNSCAAIAEGRNGAWAFGWGDSRSIAEAQALEACEKDEASCGVRVWACSR